jgi:hypothetical protein
MRRLDTFAAFLSAMNKSIMASAVAQDNSTKLPRDRHPQVSTLPSMAHVNDWLAWFTQCVQSDLNEFVDVPGLGSYRPHGHLMLAAVCFAQADLVRPSTFERIENLYRCWVHQSPGEDDD